MSLKIVDAVYSYKNRPQPAVKDFSYTFEKGVFYGIFGANGSGKSTLLKMLAGDLSVASLPEIDGRALRDFSPAERARVLAYAAQEEELMLPFTARECVKLGRYAWRDADDQVTDELLQDWNACQFADKLFMELSGGERQKIRLLRILAQDADYILLDEPASFLDMPRQLELYQKLQNTAHTQNKCIIMVCHDLCIAPSFIDEMLLMQEGRLIYGGIPDDPAAEQAGRTAFQSDFTVKRTAQTVTLSW